MVMKGTLLRAETPLNFYFEKKDYLTKRDGSLEKEIQNEASMTTTWEDYTTINGLKKIAKDT